MTDDDPAGPFLFRLHIEHTPSPNDPKEADEFYRAIGLMVWAGGRREGQFGTARLTMMAISSDALGHQLPMNCKARTILWRKAFETLPYLSQFKESGLKLLSEVEDVALDRHAIVHGLWERFNRTDPLTIGAVIIRHKNKTADGLDIRRATVTTELITEIARKANDLNLSLMPLRQFLAKHRNATKPPPENIRTV